jgi:hypothetical protein
MGQFCLRRSGLVVAVLGLAVALLLLFAAAAFAAPASNVITGSDRFDTAIRISQTMFPGGPLAPGSAVVLAPGWESYQEALCGAPLASAYGGPVLLSSITVLMGSVQAELVRLHPDRVFCIGLSSAVANAVKTTLPGATVTRINGSDVYDMSHRVAHELAVKVGSMTDAWGILTVGTNFPDAIGVSALACANLWPIVLTGTGTTANSKALATFAELGITKALKLGTYATLPPSVVYTQLSGADRYFTNCNVADWAEAFGGLTFAHVGLVTGDKFPDALAAGPYLALDDGMLLLTKYASVPPPIADTVVAHAVEVQKIDYMGLPPSCIWLISALLPGVPPPLTPALALSSTGPAVAWLEGRLTSLTYRPGPVDGTFDTKTYYGLIAFQKYEGLPLDGRVGADDWARLAVATRPVATQATTGTWIEVDKDRQVLLRVVEGVVTKTLAVSTGSPAVGVETPEGMFTITARNLGTINGMYLLCVFANVAPIGDLGIHGYTNVPTTPSSHGCIRTTLWDQNELYPQLPLGMRLFIY